MTGRRKTKAPNVPVLNEDKAFSEVVGLIEKAHQQAYQAVNTELVELYWLVGGYISRKIKTAEWDDSVVMRLAEYQTQLPDKKFLQAEQLRLSINLPFPEINDPRRVCRNVAGLGRWGNGDVEVSFSDPTDIPYVIGLIRQGLERQLANGEIA